MKSEWLGGDVKVSSGSLAEGQVSYRCTGKIFHTRNTAHKRFRSNHRIVSLCFLQYYFISVFDVKACAGLIPPLVSLYIIYLL